MSAFRSSAEFPALGFGLGLRREHYRHVLAEKPAVSWFEVISENVMVPGGNPRRVLSAVRRDYPVVLHGVSLSLGSVDPLNEDYLTALAALARETEPAWISDHLCWGSAHGLYGHDLWPVPYTHESLAHIAARIQIVQERLQRPLVLENPSSYLVAPGNDLTEWEFLAELCRRTGCGLLVDVNNVYVSAHNHGFDPRGYLAGLPSERVVQIHLAGHRAEGALLIDTHDAPVRDEVWTLYEQAMAMWGPRPTMIEWDANVPAFAVLEEELDRARAVAMRAARRPARGAADDAWERDTPRAA
jgi:uncharacterized protein (UPF0276 family)